MNVAQPADCSSGPSAQPATTQHSVHVCIHQHTAEVYAYIVRVVNSFCSVSLVRWPHCTPVMSVSRLSWTTHTGWESVDQWSRVPGSCEFCQRSQFPEDNAEPSFLPAVDSHPTVHIVPNVNVCCRTWSSRSVVETSFRSRPVSRLQCQLLFLTDPAAVRAFSPPLKCYSKWSDFKSKLIILIIIVIITCDAQQSQGPYHAAASQEYSITSR